MNVRFVPQALPEFDLPPEVPLLPPRVYQERYRRLERAREAAGFDCLAIYADREHCANLGWLTGFDPRFEEALWIQGVRNTPTLLVGNENLGYAPTQLQIAADVVLYQPFSLPDQDRSRSTDLGTLLRAVGVRGALRCGLVGWKPQALPDVPYWIVRAFADLTGDVPANAAGVLMDPADGVRVLLEPEMIRFCEYASSLTSSAIHRCVFSLQEGMSEREAAAALVSFGLELSCHPMVNFGRPIASGLGSPRNGRAVRGEYAQAAFGVIGALTCRAGRMISAASPEDDEDHYLDMVDNYLRVVHAWYGSIALGTRGGDVVAAATRAKSDAWEFAVNPGHLIHLEEWLSSPFSPGAAALLRSGQAVQQDIIPVPRRGAAVVNMEDGFVLADEELRTALRRLDPQMMERCDARRALMESLGYVIRPEVVPLSNIAGAFFPFLLDPRYVAAFS